jgi:serine protease Do
MKKIITYIVTIILSIFIGAGLMYMLIYFYPNTIIKTVSKIEKNVTVTEVGLSSGIENIYDAVVVVENYRNNKLAGIGSGFIYSENGYIMTNQHVVESSSDIKVVLMSGETIDAEIIGGDEYADIAVIKIDKKYVTKVAKLGSNDETKVGDTVFTIGSPVGSEYSGTVTRGILSGKNRMVEVSVKSSTSDWIMNVMQTDAAINPGNSGGPLCNVNGDVIGINSMKLVENQIEGIGFAIPIEDATLYADNIVSGKEIKRAYLGISMGDISSKYNLLRRGITLDNSITSGVVVYEAIKNGPCYDAGIQSGDVMIKIGDYNVKNVAQLRYYLFKYNPNDKIKVDVIRGTETKTFEIILGTSE